MLLEINVAKPGKPEHMTKLHAGTKFGALTAATLDKIGASFPDYPASATQQGKAGFLKAKYASILPNSTVTETDKALALASNDDTKLNDQEYAVIQTVKLMERHADKEEKTIAEDTKVLGLKVFDMIRAYHVTHPGKEYPWANVRKRIFECLGKTPGEVSATLRMRIERAITNAVLAWSGYGPIMHDTGQPNVNAQGQPVLDKDGKPVNKMACTLDAKGKPTMQEHSPVPLNLDEHGQLWGAYCTVNPTTFVDEAQADGTVKKGVRKTNTDATPITVSYRAARALLSRVKPGQKRGTKSADKSATKATNIKDAAIMLQQVLSKEEPLSKEANAELEYAVAQFLMNKFTDQDKNPGKLDLPGVQRWYSQVMGDLEDQPEPAAVAAIA